MKRAKVLNTTLETGIEKLKPIWDALNGEIDYFVIRAVICKNQLMHREINKT